MCWDKVISICVKCNPQIPGWQQGFTYVETCLCCWHQVKRCPFMSLTENCSCCNFLFIEMKFELNVLCQVQIAELWHVPATGWCSAQISGKACSQVCTNKHLIKFYLWLWNPPPGRGYIPALLTSSVQTRCIPSGVTILCWWASLILALRDGPGLKEDLQILLKFWSMMLSDKKYIKTQIVGGKSSFF